MLIGGIVNMWPPPTRWRRTRPDVSSVWPPAMSGPTCRCVCHVDGWPVSVIPRAGTPSTITLRRTTRSPPHWAPDRCGGGVISIDGRC